MEDNLCTPKRANELLFEVLGKPEKFTIVSMESWDRRIKIIKAISLVMPTLRQMAIYLEAARCAGPLSGTSHRRTAMILLKSTW